MSKEYIPKVGDIVYYEKQVYLVVGFLEPLYIVIVPLFQFMRISVLAEKMEKEMYKVYDVVLDKMLSILFDTSVEHYRTFQLNTTKKLKQYNGKSVDKKKVDLWWLKSRLQNPNNPVVIDDYLTLLQRKKKKEIKERLAREKKRKANMAEPFTFYICKNSTSLLYLGKNNNGYYVYLKINAEDTKKIDFYKTEFDDIKMLVYLIKNGKIVCNVNKTTAQKTDLRVKIKSSDETKDYEDYIFNVLKNKRILDVLNVYAKAFIF